MRASVMISAIAIGLVSFPALGLSHEIKAGDLIIGHPWTPEPLKGSRTGVLCMRLRNTGSTADKLLKIETSVAQSASLHESKDVAGVAKMERRESLTIPPNQEVVMKPMGLHVMLIGLTKPLSELSDHADCLSSVASLQSFELNQDPGKTNVAQQCLRHPVRFAMGAQTL